MVSDLDGPSLDDIRRAADQNQPYIVKTPIHWWRGSEIEAAVGKDTEVVIKLEIFQHSGTFKARGAITSALALDQGQLKRGVTAVSAGNHAIAAAYAAKSVGTSAKVVMFASAEPARIERCEAYGAEVVIAQTLTEGFELAEAISTREGRAYFHPFEGRNVAIGTGTLGVEFLEQAGPLDAVIVPVGGGGLCGGVANAVKALSPTCRIYGVEPTGADTMYRSFRAGEPQTRLDISTIANSLASPYALPYSFKLCRDNVDEIVLVDDDLLTVAMAMMFRELKLAIEPATAAATAALIGPLRERLNGKRVGVVGCGANIGIDLFGQYLQRGIALSGKA